MFEKIAKFVESKKDKRIKELEYQLAVEKEKSFEEYFAENACISTKSGLELAFKGKEILKVFTACFSAILDEFDAENYVVIDFDNPSNDRSYELTLKKKSKLSPIEKLKKLEALVQHLLDNNKNLTSKEAVELRRYFSK